MAHHIVHTGTKQWEINAHFLLFIQSRNPACGMVLPTLKRVFHAQFDLSGNIHSHTKVCVMTFLNPLMLPWRLTIAIPLPPCIFLCVLYGHAGDTNPFVGTRLSKDNNVPLSTPWFHKICSSLVLWGPIARLGVTMSPNQSSYPPAPPPHWVMGAHVAIPSP